MSLTDRSAETTTTAQLPALDPGITLLAMEEPVDSAIHALAVDHVLKAGGDGIWVDPGTHAQTDPLVDLAPTDRILDRFRVARGFTPFQHLDLLRSLPGCCTDRTALVVVPAIDRYYRNEELLADEGREMLLSGIAALAQVARRREIPVLLTRNQSDELSEPVRTAADQSLRCVSTPFGPRFQADGEETLAYPVDGGRWIQTTLAYWQELLAARRPLYETAGTATTRQVSHGTN